MNAEELAGIPVWVGREVVERQIPRLYAELAAAVQNNANGSRQAFENERLRLVEELARADLTSLTEAQDRFLREKLHLLEHLGEHGIQEVEGVLFRNSLDVVTAASEINRIAGEVTNAIDRSSQIKAALSGLIDPFKAPDDEIVLRKAELEIQALKLANSQAVDAIRAQADAEKRAGLEDISQAVAREHLNLDGERLAALEKSVAKLVKFIEKGGEVDVVLPITMEQMEEPQGDALRLKKDVTRIRELEQAMRALPYISGGKEEGDEG